MIKLFTAIGSTLANSAFAVLGSRLRWGLLAVFIAVTVAGVVALLVARRKGADALRGKAPNQKLSNGLVMLSSVAILAVYAAGYERTSSEAAKLASRPARPRRAPPRSISPPQVAALPQIEKPSKISRDFSSPRAPHPQSTPKERANRARPTPEVPAPSVEAGVPNPAPPTNLGTDVTPPPAPPSTAPAPTPAPAPKAAPKAHYKDGVYAAWGSCPHGDLQVSVTIQGGAITSADITQCHTRYSCSWIDDLPGQVITRQNPYVDSITGASESSDAFFYAVSDALSKASE